MQTSSFEDKGNGTVPAKLFDSLLVFANEWSADQI